MPNAKLAEEIRHLWGLRVASPAGTSDIIVDSEIPAADILQSLLRNHSLGELQAFLLDVLSEIVNKLRNDIRPDATAMFLPAAAFRLLVLPCDWHVPREIIEGVLAEFPVPLSIPIVSPFVSKFATKRLVLEVLGKGFRSDDQRVANCLEGIASYLPITAQDGPYGQFLQEAQATLTHVTRLMRSDNPVIREAAQHSRKRLDYAVRNIENTQAQ